MQVANYARCLLATDNAFSAKEQFYAMLNPALMKGVEYAGANGELKLKVRTTNGALIERSLRNNAGFTIPCNC